MYESRYAAIWDILVLNLILMRMRSSEDEQGEITKPGCKVRVFVIPTNEELAIARETLALVKINFIIIRYKRLKILIINRAGKFERT